MNRKMKQPQIKQTQFAVLMADGSTGNVLTTAGQIYHGDNQEVYMIFDDLQSANQYIANKQGENDTVDCSVFDSNYVLIAHEPAIKWR